MMKENEINSCDAFLVTLLFINIFLLLSVSDASHTDQSVFPIFTIERLIMSVKTFLMYNSFFPYENLCI